VPAVALDLAQRGDALALEMVERGAPPEPAPTSVDERITRALAGAGRPVPLVRRRMFSVVVTSTPEERNAWLREVEDIVCAAFPGATSRVAAGSAAPDPGGTS
jgi:hypothetical protein